MKTFGYVRVSSKEQNVARQIETMKSQGIEERDLFIDKVSGKDFDRPEYQLLKKMVREGDIVVFDSITRMGRSMNDTISEYEWFVKNGGDEQDDIMKQAIQKIILTLLTAFAEKERDEIRTRQAEGIAVAKRRGVKFGRPSLAMPKDWEKYYKKWKAKEITAVQFMDSIGMAKATFYRKVKEYECK